LIETLTFGSPDRIPFEPGGPRESTRRAWADQGLEGEDWYRGVCEHLGVRIPRSGWLGVGVSFRMIPQFEEKVLERRDGHLVVQDWKGNICEISEQFDLTYLRQAKDFVTRSWIRCPVEGPADWEAMKARYDIDAPGRFPEDFEKRCREFRDRSDALTIGFPGPFWQMREWCGFEGLCLMMIEQPALVDEMADFWRRFVSALLERILARVVPDRLFIGEDMAYKEKAMISPGMVRRWCMPSWSQWAAQATEAGCPLIELDSDGYVGELIPLWIESGINVNSPLEVAAGNDLPAWRQQYGRKMAYRQGVDKRAMAAGGDVLRAEMQRLEPTVRAGGYIPGCDHGVPSNVAWPDFLDYCEQLARMTGWL
jgi:uroporphyrinogen decarboxylase